MKHTLFFFAFFFTVP
ncbi:pheA operon leader peptide PheL [Escherichia marmotae]|nr:pheA operon leader peptide PheL [Escherichia marmotae]MBC6527009.1 hypothetical protein [Escherichia marmotae]MED9511350.1 pheA operon leader peptide PheL [Escherichia marmotae]